MMDISMDYNSVSTYRRAYSGENICKLSADAVIPDTLEDISRLLGTEFSYKIISKDALFGKVTVSGELEAVSSFITQSSENVESIRTVIPFSSDFPGEDIDSASIPIADIRIIASDRREVNPRKIGISADVAVAVTAYNKSELKLPTKPETCDKVFFKTESLSAGYISSVSEKLSTLDDEREATGASSIVSHSTDYIYDGFELVGSRLIVKAHAHNRVILLKDSREAAALEFDLPFSQLFDSEENADIADCELTLVPAVEYFELTDGVLCSELRIVSQLVCYERKELSCLTDAYACGMDYSLSKDKLAIIKQCCSADINKTVSLTAELPEGVSEAFITSINFGRASKNGWTASVPIIVDLLYNDKTKGLNFLRVRDNIEFENIECDKFKPLLSASKCALISGKVQIELQIALRCASRETSDLEVISSVVLSEEEDRRPRPSLYIVRAENSDIWDISKKYGADQNRILAINSISSEEDMRGKMLLIPTT